WRRLERFAKECENLPDRARRRDEGNEPDVTAAVRALERKLLPHPRHEVADMDFPAAEVILDAIRDRVAHGVFGYTHDPPGFAPALAAHQSSRHGWAIDWDALEAAVTPRSKLFLLCHPHNPTGTVWTRADLERLAAFAARHSLAVVSDEIWADLVLDEDRGVRPVPFASLDHPLARAAITLTAPSKTWNLAGLARAFATG
ncbi:MAG: aminotransferase class I/II-fold pyridoxal phosphate-dependent enzyme, partial [Planctomycetia bacterium]